MKINYLDHIVLSVRDIAKSCDFYQKVLGMEVIIFGENRKALKFGKQKINLHQFPSETEPKASSPSLGSSDFCLITKTPLSEVIRQLEKQNIPIILGIVERTGACGKICSIYIRDPDLNLIEIANYVDELEE